MASAKKGLANEYKRSVGKTLMMRKLRLIPERQAEEAAVRPHARRADMLVLPVHRRRRRANAPTLTR